MSVSLHAKVLKNQAVGPQVLLLRLEAPALAREAQPGQFIMLRVGPGPEPLLARPFSVHGVEEGKLSILYQVKGRGTRLLSQARPGAELLAWGPLGRGFNLEVKRPLLAAGGMGVAPLAFVSQRLEEAGAAYEAYYGLASRDILTAGDPVSGEGAFYLEDWGWRGGQRGRQHRPSRPGQRAPAPAPGESRPPPRGGAGLRPPAHAEGGGRALPGNTP